MVNTLHTVKLLKYTQTYAGNSGLATNYLPQNKIPLG